MVNNTNPKRGGVYLVGVGRMGRLVARGLAGWVDLTLVGRDKSRLEAEAGPLGVKTASMDTNFAGAEAVILALPTEVTAEVLAEIAPRIPDDAIVINVATAVMRGDLMKLVPKERLVAAKFVGHYYDMEAGGNALVVVEAETPQASESAMRLMGHCGPIVAGREEWVLTANRVAAEEGIRMAIRIQRRLEAVSIPENYVDLAVTAVACGSTRAFMAGSLGPFGQVIADRIRAEMPDKPE